MSLEFSAAYNLMKNLAQKINGNKQITKKDVEDLLKKSDTDGDGIVSEAEFKNVYMSTEDYMKLEKDYLEAFKAISELDGKEGLSQKDLDSAVTKYEKEQEEELEVPEEVASPGGGDPGPSSPTTNPEDKSNGNLDPVALSEKNTMEQLSDKRNEAIDTLSEQREAKEAAIAEADEKVNAAKELYNNATDALADRIEQKEEELTLTEKNIVLYNDCKQKLNTQIDSQKTAVNDSKTKVDECKTRKSDIEGQISALGSAPPETITVTDEEGNETTAPNPEYESWVAQKEALEAQLAEAEDELVNAEVDLADAEDELTSLESELDLVEQSLNGLIEDYSKTEAAADKEIQTLKTNIDTANKEYSEAKTNKYTIAEPFNAELDKAKADLRAYDEAIRIEEMPADWSKEEKTGLEKVDKANLPADYEVKSDGNIYDSDGNVVGKVVSGSEDETTGEKSEDKYYLKKAPEKQRLSFSEKYDIAISLAKGKNAEEDEFNPNAVWDSYDFSSIAPEDIAMIAELYETKVAENKEDNNGEAIEGIPASFIDAAKQYLNDEEGTAAQFKDIVGGILKESDNNEKAAEMLNREVENALKSGDTAVIDAIIAKADSNYKEFMQYVENTGLPADIQEKMGKDANELLGKLYSKVDQHKETDAESYGIESTRAEQLKSDYKTLEGVIKAINDGGLSNPDEINYLLAQFGSSAEIMKSANALVESGKIEAEDINTIFRVSTTKQNEIMEALNENPELKEFIKEKGLDPMTSSQQDIEKAIQEKISMDTEAKLIEHLMMSQDGTDEKDKVSTNAEDYGLTEEEAQDAKAKYVDSASKEESIKNILNAFKNDEISPDTAKYLLAEVSEGVPKNLIAELRNMNDTEREYINQLYEVYTPLPELSSGNTTQSLKPAPTLEEFLASVDDPMIKGWYEKMFSSGMYDYDTFWNKSNIPRDFQSVYTQPFANGTIRSAGCGITSLSMISEALTGKHVAPTELTQYCKGDNPASALEGGLDAMNVKYDRLWGNDALARLDSALESGKPVIVNYRGNSLFTTGGHFVVIAGKTADGKYIVNDPNIENYWKSNMIDGFTNGFTREQIEQGLNHVYFF